MKITPLEIRQKTFEKIFRGYDKDEVNAYLQSLSMEWERMLEENKKLEHKIENLSEELNKLRDLESSLFKTLKTAEDTGANLIEQAEKETALKLKESQMNSVQILVESKEKAKKLVEASEIKKKQILDEMMNKMKALEGQHSQLMDLKEKVVDQIRNYATELKDSVVRFDNKALDVDISKIVSATRKIYNSSLLDEEVPTKTMDDIIEDKSETDFHDIEEPISDMPDEIAPSLDQEKGKRSTKSFFDEIE